MAAAAGPPPPSAGAAGPIVRSVPPPPCAPVSLSAASRTYSSLPFGSRPLPRSTRKPSPRRSLPTIGTALTRTTMRKLDLPDVARSAAAREHVAPDDVPLDLLGPLVELRDLRVAHHALHGVDRKR